MILNYTYNSCCYCWYKIKFMKWIKRIKIEGKSLRLHLCIVFFLSWLIIPVSLQHIYCQFVILLLHFLSLLDTCCVFESIFVLYLERYVCKIRLFLLFPVSKKIHYFGKRNITLRWAMKELIYWNLINVATLKVLVHESVTNL